MKTINTNYNLNKLAKQTKIEKNKINKYLLKLFNNISLIKDEKYIMMKKISKENRLRTIITHQECIQSKKPLKVLGMTVDFSIIQKNHIGIDLVNRNWEYDIMKNEIEEEITLFNYLIKK